MKTKMNFKKLFAVIGADILIAASIIGLFAYDALLSPQAANPITVIPTETHEFGLPDDPKKTHSSTTNEPDSPDTPYTSTYTPDTDDYHPLPTPTPTPSPTEVYADNYSAVALTELGYNVLMGKRYDESPFRRVVTQLVDDTGDGARFIISKVEIPGSEDDKITYYVVDLYVNRVTNILTNVSVNSKGELDSEEVATQAEAVGAKLAISGDYFRNSKIGYIVRNGMLYRDAESKNDYCILKTDGSLVCVDGKTFEEQKEIYIDGAWQCWAFGPTLLAPNGKVIKNNANFNINGGRYHSIDITNNGIQNKHPRSAIGYIDDGHYLLVLVDGRSEGYSSGASLIELSQIMYDEGCRQAYNLDGGRSAVLWYDGQIVNTPYKDGREISDIIYIKKGGSDT